VAGEIAVDEPNFLNPVIAAQHFEYKIANIMDASLQSVFGFIGVLPGAFSAYRYEAIRSVNGVGPLAEYFKSLTASKKELGLCVGNMYLAEDRILCFEILARKDCDWTMHYVKDAIAHTDVPETLVDLIKQRRRWLNGAFFAGLFAIWNFGRVWSQSAHSFPRKCAFTLQFAYLAFQNVMNWFLLSNLFLTFFYILSLALYNKSIELLRVILATYFVLVGSLIIFALGNKPGHRTAVYYSVASYVMGTIMLCVTCISLYALLGGVQFADPPSDLPSCSVGQYELLAGAFFSLGIIFVCAFMHGEFAIVRSTLQYFFMLPTFVNVLGIYAYSNLHDLSWGTKGIESSTTHNGLPAKWGSVKDMVALHLNATHTDVVSEAEKQKGAVAAEHEDVDNRFRVFRSLLLLMWLLSNGCWLYYATSFISCSCYLKYLSYVVAVFNTIRFLGGLVFLTLRLLRGILHCCRQGVKKTSELHPLMCGNPQAGDCSPV
ncbi:chitin synthase (Chitin-UDP-GlcNac-transferase), partial [Thraustotheca clavata]